MERSVIGADEAVVVFEKMRLVKETRVKETGVKRIMPAWCGRRHRAIIPIVKRVIYFSESSSSMKVPYGPRITS